MNNALLYIGGLLVVALAALFAVPYFIDWNRYRGVFEEEASRVLGRDVRVGGAVNLRLLPAPYVRFEKLKIADAGDESGESFFRAESFTMWLSVPPLLKGVLEANKVELKRPVVKLVTNDTGGGNWQSLSIEPGAMPFVPKDVAFQSVTLHDGVISLGSAAEGELARIEGISGELAAETLFGPYKFAGALEWQGHPREVRLSTARQDASGEVRFKSSVRARDTGNSYVLTGRIIDLNASPKIEADVKALVRMGLASAESAQTGQAEKVVEAAKIPQSADELAAEVPDRPALLPEHAAGGPPFGLDAKLKGDVNGFELSDIALSLDGNGAPQLVSGMARLGWAGKLRLDVALSSRWLDLDRLAGVDKGKAVPAEAVRGYFEALMRHLPDTADTHATLSLDQVTLGGEAVSGVRVTALRSGGPLELKQVRAQLPGGARLDLEGVLSGKQETRAFDGVMSVTGQSLARFLSWSLDREATVQGRAEGAFALEGRLKLDAASIEFAEATAELAGMPLTGAVKLELGKRRKLDLTIEGQRVDVGSLWPGCLEAQRIGSFLEAAASGTGGGNIEGDRDKARGESGEAPAGATAGLSDAKDWLSASTVDVDLRLRASELIDGERILTDVDWDVAIVGGALSMPALRFTAPGRLTVDLEGEAKDVTGNAKGIVQGTISAPTEEAAASFFEFVGLAGSGPQGRAGYEAFAPLKVAGTLEIGQRTEKAADVRFDGMASGGRIYGEVRLDGGWRGWRTDAVDAGLALENADAGRLARALLGAGEGLRPLNAAAEPGRLQLHAAGTPAKGLLAVGVLEEAGRSLAFDGKVTFADAGSPGIAGDVVVKGGDARSLAALAGVRLGGGAAGVPVQGGVAVDVAPGVVGLELRGLLVAGSKVAGLIKVARSEAAQPILSADLDVDAASIPGLLRVMLERAAPAAGEAPAEAAVKAPVESKGKRAAAVQAQLAAIPQLEAAATIWPEQGFDGAVFDALSGSAKVRIQSLALEPGLAMSDAAVELSLSPGRVAVERLSARALGGRVSSRLVFDKAAAGVALTGDVAIDVGSGKEPPAEGEAGDVASFRLDLTGRALGLGALISSLTGKGRLVAGDVTLTGNTPQSVAAVAEAALQGRGPNSGDDLVAALKSAVKSGSLPLGKLAVPVTLDGGRLQLEPVQLETADGRSSFRTVVDLQSLRIDSAWQIEPKVTKLAPQPAAVGSGEAKGALGGAGQAQTAVPQAATGERIILPGVSVTYAGKLRDLGSIEPIVATAALERELSVRKMERDVDELERLRRLDQERAKADLERQRALEAERTRALEGVPANAEGGGLPAGGEPAPGSPDGALSPGQDEGNAAADGAAQAAEGALGGAAAEGQATNQALATPEAGVEPEAKPVARPPRKKPKPEVWQPFQNQQF